jgi:hypothetical protein
MWPGFMLEIFVDLKSSKIFVGMVLNLKVCCPQTVTYMKCQQRVEMQKFNIIQFGY